MPRFSSKIPGFILFLIQNGTFILLLSLFVDYWTAELRAIAAIPNLKFEAYFW